MFERGTNVDERNIMFSTKRLLEKGSKTKLLAVLSDGMTRGSLEDLKSSSESFIASANRDLIPVVSVNGNQIGDGKIGPVYKYLMRLYQEEILKISI